MLYVLIQNIYKQIRIRTSSKVPDPALELEIT
jgi:hypothetical protein